MKNKLFVVGILALVPVFGMMFIGCDSDTPTENGTFVAVTDITNFSGKMSLGSPLSLNGIVVPTNVTNKNITWSIKNANNTGAVLNGNVLTVAGIGKDWGWFPVTATITDGIDSGIPFTKDFNINISRYNEVTKTLFMTINGGASWRQEWSSGGFLLKDWYNGEFKEGTNYKITIKGNTDTAMSNVTLNVRYIPNNGPNYYFTEQYYYGPISINIGQFEETFNVRTKTASDFALYKEFYDISFSNNWNSTFSMLESDQGKVMAKISNFSWLIQEL
jgi:hypothetical protein